MVRGFSWRSVLGWDGHSGHGHRRDHWWDEPRRRLLPTHRNEAIQSAIPADEVTRVAVRLHHLLQEVVAVELEEDQVTMSHSRVITPKVVEAAKAAAGEEYKACVVFALLVNVRWYKHQAIIELWDADLHKVRAIAAEVIAKKIIESEENLPYLLHSVLLKRYAIVVDGEAAPPTNVIEKAVDLHALRVVGSSGYQKCISYLWRGWLVQDENDPANFVDYGDKDSTSFIVHLDPDRMRAPMYQNAFQVLISLVYLGLYTAAINTINPTGDLDFVEGLLYIFTVSFVFDEIAKIWKAGYHIIGFWNVFNDVLYGLLLTSLVLRFVALSHGPSGDLPEKGPRERYNTLSYSFLAFSAPLFWIRLLLYLDSFRFFGAMLVVLKVMMKESIIFFALLAVIIVGFLQSFIGLDYAEDNIVGDVPFIMQSMANALMQAPDFSGFEKFGPPFGIILYYLFTFIVMVILLNILIALYNSAYQDIYDNANDEFLCLFAQKTVQFVRAPDENVFIPPFNLIEVFCLAIPLEWWMSKRAYERVNDVVMAICYFPLLLMAAFFETRIAGDIRANRLRGDEDDDTIEEWEQMDAQADFEAEGWAERVQKAKPNLGTDPAVVEIGRLREDVERLQAMLQLLTRKLGGEDGGGGGGAVHDENGGSSKAGTNLLE